MAHAKSCMIQGTMSNAGKSLLVAGLCRIFARRGYRVAPFKSQNMALNSGVTADGFEMGRAQIMQAEAAGTHPDVRMNPILLKPTSNTGSQVIVMGQPIDTMQAKEYYAFKHTLRKTVREAYDQLASEYDLIFLEGAGSPAEINLKDDDLVNMGMAKMAQAPVLLAGDIDPGGVFAQLYGTIKLLDADEQRYVKGFIVNKFRGDVDILRPGLAPLEKLCGVPCLGVVPYMQLDIDDEDSLAMRLSQAGRHGAAAAAREGAEAATETGNSESRFLDVAVIRLAHLSNFTDFNALERHEAIALRYVSQPQQLGRPDLVILPGTKNTMGDMRWLHESGMARCIQALAQSGTYVLGICGGYQMLGALLSDPDGVEDGGELAGLGLLPLQTVFTADKRLTQTTATVLPLEGPYHALSGKELQGYEIHMGETHPVSGASCPAVMQLHTDPPRLDGGVAGSVLGTYLHGFFDAPQVVDAFVELLAHARGLEWSAAPQADAWNYKQRQYDLLADGMEAALDMDALERIIQAGV